MVRKASAVKVQEGSAHLDNKKEMTKAPTEKKHSGSTLMDGIVVGLTRNISPPIVDGIVRGLARGIPMSSNYNTTSVSASATKNTAGAFGAGNTPEHAR